ncbi:MAG: hypothetical protein KKD69_06855 [Euryarchaeota archaeon]|nr:hypothetical protein [Euryarchaeota archaeon]MBU4492165.1 hypothetical protein [Euryarchaeota archaeon]MCG2727684.1 hypothetical protein [Candidatus Methanoperedenaceae archaeon]
MTYERHLTRKFHDKLISSYLKPINYDLRSLLYWKKQLESLSAAEEKETEMTKITK